MSTPASVPRWVAAWLIACIGVVWLAPAPYYNNLNNPNENVRVYMTRSIVEFGTFAIDPVVEEWGYVNDKATYEGRLFPGKAPGSSLLAVPLYGVYHLANEALDREPHKHEVVRVCRLFGSVFPLIAFLLAFAAFARRLHDPVARVTSLIALALGSTVFAYGMIFASHATMAACLFAGWMASKRHRETPHLAWPPFLVGTFVGWAVALEYPGFLGAAAVGLHAIAVSPRRLPFIGWSALGAAIPIGLVMLFHYEAFGSPFSTPYSNLENPEFIEHVSGGFFGMERVQGDALFGSFLAPSNGLFWFMPWTLVALASLPLALRRPRTRQEALLTLIILAAYTVFISMVHNWRGGWTAGPRYIVGVVPFLAWQLGRVIEASRNTPWRATAIVGATATVGLGVIACGLSGILFPHYPTEVANPIFEIGTAFVQAGYYPHSAWMALGITPQLSFALTLGAMLLVLPLPILVAAELDPIERGVALSLASGVILFALALAGGPSTENEYALRTNQAFVQLVWEPRPNALEEDLRNGRLPSYLLQDDTSPAVLRAAARRAARAGYSDTAAVLYRRALDADVR